MAFHFACAAVPISSVQCQERSHKSQPCHQIILIHQRGNPQTPKPPETSEDFPIQRYPFFHLSLAPHRNPQPPIKTPPPPASTVRSHDFPGTDGGVVLRMRRCGLGVRPGDKPEGPAAVVAIPGCTLAHPKRQSSKLGTPPPKSSIPKNDGLENASRFKHG